MPTALMIDEWHSSDLLNPCMHAVKLRHEGKVIGDMGEALYKGNVFHEAAGIVHLEKMWDDAGVKAVVKRSRDIAVKKGIDEGRRMSLAVQREEKNHLADVCRWLAAYIDRFAELFARMTLIGVEVPVRFTMPVDGEPVAFASHMDLVFADPDVPAEHLGRVFVWDWKTGKESPTRAYLQRNPQLAMYFYGLLRGHLQVDGEWLAFGEVATLEWIHVRNLLPFGKATTCKEGLGHKKTYAKGDKRPDNQVRRDVLMDDVDGIVEALAMRPRMARLGLWPKNPDNDRCHLCESRRFCNHFEQEQRGEEF